MIVMVRQGQAQRLAADGFHITYRDNRTKPARGGTVHFRPSVVEEWPGGDDIDLVMVCVRAHQLDALLPQLGAGVGSSDVLFFENNWWGDERIAPHLSAAQCLFGVSRLVGGWRNGNSIECVFFDQRELVTVLGERDGTRSPRVERLARTSRKPAFARQSA